MRDEVWRLYRLGQEVTKDPSDEYEIMLHIITVREQVWRIGGFERRAPGFLDRNYAIEGPNGLVRHRIGNGCISHGTGTWDCIVGDFD